ncbi:hypothetical protein RND81_O182100 [Saponaria officinalis]|uniref:Cytochrome c assembly protein domain-containing protein n=1 Tax=Saponaria officinalis TaxID=3572 RepID=A0AAW1GBF0_SAPOF
MIVPFLSITGLLVTRWVYGKHFPLSDLYESLIFLSWGFYIIHMIPYLKKQKNKLSLSIITAPSAIFTQGFATSGLLTEMHQSSYISARSSIPLVNDAQSVSPLSVKNYYRSQLIEQLNHWSYRVISLGFILVTIGILSGAVWANEAWGSYWNWDPKETWAFITWTVFAIYLHIRTNKNLQSANSAIVAFIGFLIIWICYFGVNLLGIGLHSYGSFTLTLN